jgi:hypothetical protein
MFNEFKRDIQNNSMNLKRTQIKTQEDRETIKWTQNGSQQTSKWNNEIIKKRDKWNKEGSTRCERRT